MMRPRHFTNDELRICTGGAIRNCVVGCILWCHHQLPEDADYNLRAELLDGNAPVHWPREHYGWKVWRHCRDQYLALLWPGRPAPELTPETAPLLFWRDGVTA